MQNANKTTTVHKIDDYLHRIETHEKAERRKKSLYALLFFAVVGIGFTAYKTIYFQNSLRTYSAADLSYEKVQALFTENEAPIIISHPDIGQDTVKSVEDYITVLNLLDLIEQNRNLAISVSDTISSGETAQETEQNSLSPYMVDIDGERKQGRNLTFSIENFDPEVTYMLDFGNGFRRKVSKSFTYVYDQSGRYRIQLLATKGNVSNVYTKRLEISADERVGTQIAEATKSVNEPESIIDLNSGKEAEVKTGTQQPEESVESGSAENTASTTPSVTEREASSSPVEDPESFRTENTRELPSRPAPQLTNEVAKPANTSLNKPLVAAQLMPEFPGGTKALARFFNKNYRYPLQAMNDEVEGVVYVRFIVNPDGSLSNAKVVKGVGYGCDEEAIRLVSLMPKWIPGEQDGKKVAVYKTIPITFRLLN
ncbi:MAG: TonB family protein [Bacteroidia bacterium]|nr:TonB family protein [Bacteroidia bacterium]